MRLTITGADGQLGHELQAAFQDDSIVPLVWPAFDVLKPDAGEEWVDVTMIADVAPNDLVLVHAGAAITRLADVPLRQEKTARDIGSGASR